MKSLFSGSFTCDKLLIFISVLNCVFSRKIDNYYSRSYYEDERTQYVNKINTAIDKLQHGPTWVKDWPNVTVTLGQVSGVTVDPTGLIIVFHRASNTWDGSTFTLRNVYTGIGTPPISDPTILAFNESGELVDMWGQNLFYMPHGITVDKDGNVWVTDVALHQVFKFPRDQRTVPSITLGEKFVPGDDDHHFCKPTAVAVHSSGDFFVADGYCNSRIVKYTADGTKVLQWGRRPTGTSDSPFVLYVPHALTVAEEHGAVCAADRERGRVACFRDSNGTYTSAYSSWLLGPRVFSVAFANIHGGRLYVVNGPAGDVPVRGYVIDFVSGRLVATFAPLDGLRDPHDVAVTSRGDVYVAELARRVLRFTDPAIRNESERESERIPLKPTATVDITGSSMEPVWVGWRGWGGWGAWGGAAAGALAASLLAGAAALRAARDRGRKGGPRRRWEYGHEFKLRRLLERRRFTRLHSDDSDDEPAPMLPPAPTTASHASLHAPNATA